MITFVSLCIQVATLLLAFASFVDAGPYFGFCKETCEKHRTTDSAYTLDCNDHPGDGDCRTHCWFCRNDICDDYKKVYRCPDNPDKKSKSTSTETGAATGIVIIIAIVVVVLVICVAGIGGCIYFARRNQNRGVMGGRGMGVAYPMSQQGQGMYYPTNPTVTTVQSMPSQQQYQTTFGSASSTTTTL